MATIASKSAFLEIGVLFPSKKIGIETMESTSLNMPFNEAQLELLKLFSRNLDEADLLEIKRLVVRYLGKKITQKADALWDEKGWTDADMENLLEMHERTPYNPHN